MVSEQRLKQIANEIFKGNPDYTFEKVLELYPRYYIAINAYYYIFQQERRLKDLYNSDLFRGILMYHVLQELMSMQRQLTSIAHMIENVDFSNPQEYNLAYRKLLNQGITEANISLLRMPDMMRYTKLIGDPVLIDALEAYEEGLHNQIKSYLTAYIKIGDNNGREI